MKHTDAIIIGGGQAGLAASHCLKELGVEHVVLERGRVAERWLSQRWDSLRLLTPNWQTRLPGYGYRGNDPRGFMRAGELALHLARYARAFDAPVQTQTAVQSVTHQAYGDYLVQTDRGSWQAPCVVIATGACDQPFIPPAAARLSSVVEQIVPSRYRNPQQLPPGGVLVVGASATGAQLAEEIHQAGHPVTLSVGKYTRVPRRYRGRDIMEWLDAIGALDETLQQARDVEAARRGPSLQLKGTLDGSSLNLNTLSRQGVRVVGEVQHIEGSRVQLSSGLAKTIVSADLKLTRLLNRIDDAIETGGYGGSFPAEAKPGPVDIPPAASEIDLARAGIRSVVWATGFRRSYPWLRVAGLLDHDGELRHRGGVTSAPGIFCLGLPFNRHRNSTFIDGVGRDARFIAKLIHRRLGAPSSQAA